MTNVMIYTGMFLVASLAVMNIADVLVNGSIFEGLRSAIAYRRDRGQWLFKILNQLFTCMLCMSTQVALWIIAIPAAVILHEHTNNWLAAASLGALVAMAVAGFSLGIWMAFQYSPKRFHALKQENDMLWMKLEELERMKTQRSQSKKNRQTFRTAFSLEVFGQLIESAEAKCSDIGCSVMETYCSFDVWRAWYAPWAEENPISTNFPGFTEQLVPALLEFKSHARGYSKGSSERAELLRWHYENLLKKINAYN